MSHVKCSMLLTYNMTIFIYSLLLFEHVFYSFQSSGAKQATLHTAKTQTQWSAILSWELSVSGLVGRKVV